jgi:YHS domain-containing protein
VIRFLALAVLAFLIFLVLRAAVAGFLAGLRGTRHLDARGGSRRNELVKDPVCETYVPRRTAVARTAGPTTYYFCSAACAEKFKIPS